MMLWGTVLLCDALGDCVACDALVSSFPSSSSCTPSFPPSTSSLSLSFYLSSLTLSSLLPSSPLCLPSPPPPPSLLQVSGRAIILFVVLDTNKQLHDHPVVWVLFLVWSLIELVRYVKGCGGRGMEKGWRTMCRRYSR